MKKHLMILALVAGIVANAFAQNVGTNLTGALPFTNPTSLSQLEVQAKLFTQNSFQISSISDVRATGNFGTTARWNSLGNLNAGTQTLNGLRTQTNGRGLVFGHSIPNGGVVSNPFIQWVGNVTGAGVQPGDLEFRVAENPSAPATDKLVMRLKSNRQVLIGETDIISNEFGATAFLTNVNAVNGGIFTKVSDDATPNVSKVGVRAEVSLSTAGGFGVSATVNNSSLISGTSSVGVAGRAFGGQSSIGVSGITFGSSAGTQYGIFGGADNVSGRFAGFFTGNVFVTGTITTPSDKRLKTNINSENEALNKILQLNPVNYYFEKSAVKDLKVSPQFQHGFIAQELETIFPEMVTEVSAPVLDETDINTPMNIKRMENFKSINYTMLIPMLTKAIQEQQEMLVALKNEIAILKNTQQLAKVTSSGYTLSQNVPNPFSGNTIINYTLPASTERAILLVTDLNGKIQQQYNLAKASTQQTISGNSLAAGIYLYSLIVNGNEVISKRMVLTK